MFTVTVGELGTPKTGLNPLLAYENAILGHVHIFHRCDLYVRIESEDGQSFEYTSRYAIMAFRNACVLAENANAFPEVDWQGIFERIEPIYQRRLASCRGL